MSAPTKNALLVRRLRQFAGYAAVENNFDGDLKPEDTIYGQAADTIESLERALVAMYREHQTACALAEDANARILELLADPRASASSGEEVES